MTNSTRRPGLGKIVNGALVLLAFGLLGLVIWRNREQIERVLSRPLDLRLFALAFLVYAISVVLTFVRWFFLVRVIEPNFKLSATMVLGAIGMVFNLVIPGAVGGDLIKATYLGRMRIKRTQAIASMVIDRILGLLALFILAAIAGAIAWSAAGRDVSHACGGRVARNAFRLPRSAGDLHADPEPVVSETSWESVEGRADRGGASRNVHDIPRPPRCRRGLPAILDDQPHAQRLGVLSGRPHALPRDDHDPGTALLDGAPHALHSGCSHSIWCAWRDRACGWPAPQAGGAPGRRAGDDGLSPVDVYSAGCWVRASI